MSNKSHIAAALVVVVCENNLVNILFSRRNIFIFNIVKINEIEGVVKLSV